MSLEKSKDYWKAKNAFGELTVGEFWRHCRPEGRAAIELVRRGKVLGTGNLEKFELTDQSLRIQCPDGRWVEARLSRKMTVTEKHVKIMTMSDFSWLLDHPDTIVITFEKEPDCKI